MKYLAVLFLFSSILSAQNDSSYSGLDGFQDSQGNTHLFYRKYLPDISNNLYHLNLETNVEEKIADGYWETLDSVSVYGGIIRFRALDFINGKFNSILTIKNPTDLSYHIVTNIRDSIFSYSLINAKILEFYISSDKDLIIAPFQDMNNSGVYGIVKSFDSGRTWKVDSTYNASYYVLGISPFDMNLMFATNSTNEVARSTNGGVTFEVVETDFDRQANWLYFYFDIDGSHIYASTVHGIYVSDNNGESNSWTLVYSYNVIDFVPLALDNTQSGLFNFSSYFDNKVWISEDYGLTYSAYKNIPRNAYGGIYKASGSNKLYAATRYAIYELTDTSSKVIKQLPLTSLDYYQLAVGNKWLYDIRQTDGIVRVQYFSSVKVKYDTLMPNNKTYYYVERGGGLYYESAYERIDSNGFVYKYSSSVNGSEYAIEDLAISEHIWDDTLFIEPDGSFKYCEKIDVGVFFGESRYYKIIVEEAILHYVAYELVYGIGMTNLSESYDFGTSSATLLGAVIDGVLYGDTLTVGVEPLEKPTSYLLGQNYPNPFNPETTINYSIPKSGNVLIKVYSVLGEKIITLLNEFKTAGNYTITFDGKHLPSGVYFYHIEVNDFSMTKKMVLSK